MKWRARWGPGFPFPERRRGGQDDDATGLHTGADEVAVVVEDVITTGGSTREVVDILGAAGVRVVAAGSIH